MSFFPQIILPGSYPIVAINFAHGCQEHGRKDGRVFIFGHITFDEVVWPFCCFYSESMPHYKIVEIIKKALHHALSDEVSSNLDDLVTCDAYKNLDVTIAEFVEALKLETLPEM